MIQFPDLQIFILNLYFFPSLPPKATPHKTELHFLGKSTQRFIERRAMLTTTYPHSSPSFSFINRAASEPAHRELPPRPALPSPSPSFLLLPRTCTGKTDAPSRGKKYLKLMNYFHLKGYEIYLCSLVGQKLHRSWEYRHKQQLRPDFNLLNF